MQFDIISIGTLLVEIMRKDLDKDFDQQSEFLGPFPSGDTPIFINAAAKLGQKCGFIGTVGGDGFGKSVINRLQGNHVDTRYIRIIEDVPTAVTFVAYFHDGSRKFLYHLHNSAADLLCKEDVVEDYVKNAKWVHITGFALSGNRSSQEAALKILDYISDDVQVSFDPNIRVEALGVEALRKVAAPVIERASIVLPSGNEAKKIMGTKTDEEACQLLVQQGKLVVHKKGEHGCQIYNGTQIIDVPAFDLEEVDPTGAGDTFCAAFIAGLIEGRPLYDIGLFANAAAALSITKKGPMEGAPTRDEVENLMWSHKK